MKQLGLMEYFCDFWNIIDSTQFVVFGYLTYIKIFEKENEDQPAGIVEVFLLVFSLF